MSFSRVFVALLSASSLAVVLAGGCSSSTGASTGTGGGDAGDGRYHPGTDNGTHDSETTACAELLAGQKNALMGASCTVTVQLCPSLLRSQFTTACQEYDDGSVQGCIAYYAKQSGCPAIEAAIAACAITPFAGTAPNGCADGGM